MDKNTEINTTAYTVKDIARMLNIGRNSAYTLVKQGNFKIMRIGNMIFSFHN